MYYRVVAANLVGDTTVYPAPAVGYPTMEVNSSPTNIVNITPLGTRIGTMRPSNQNFYLDYNGNGVFDGTVIDRQYAFGQTGLPVSGDWNLNGITEIGIYNNATHIFRLDYNGNGIWDGTTIDRQYSFGATGDLPVSGDWNGDGRTEIGVYRSTTHTFYLDYNGNGVYDGSEIDRQYTFGANGDLPTSGDWNLDGISEIGVYRSTTHTFYLDYNGNGVFNGSTVDRQYTFGANGDQPVSGDWNIDGRTEIGTFRPTTHVFYLDYNGNGTFDGAVTDRQYTFGANGDRPTSGKWS